MEQREGDVVLGGPRGEISLRAIERQIRRQDAGILRRVRVAEHDLQPEASRIEPAPHAGKREQDVQHSRKVTKHGGIRRFWVRGYHRPRGGGYVRGR